MDQTIEEFFHDFRQEMLAGAEANSTFQLEVFTDILAKELVETGFIEGFEHCHYKALRGMKIDGYWFDEEGTLDIFVADFEFRRELESLIRTDVDALFKRLINFFEASVRGTLEPDVTTLEYGLAKEILARRPALRKVNFYLLSERVLSDKVQGLDDNIIDGLSASYHIWDMSRFQRQRSSRGGKEALDINFSELFDQPLSCLPANLGLDSYQSYLIVMPASILAALYERFSARLLEQNVRTFLQARAQVNKGIRATILNEPAMFFAYNNGITATAQHVETKITDGVLQIVRITDLQIVNGGQTTASLFHTQWRDKADLTNVFVQMKLSVIDSEESELVVPRISEYANTQNRVNPADFFSNHPFHVRMADFSRRIWAPAQKGVQRETKWFYERARGQYLDAQSKLTASDVRKFKAENPKPQMFSKTDLAKFENVFDDHPKWVNQGSQKNFSHYATRIGKEWEKFSDDFNELYFRRAIARGILFRSTEKLVSQQAWYNGGYRANIVAYTLSMMGEIARRRNEVVNFQRIWAAQALDEDLSNALVMIAKAVAKNITAPPQGISNVSEWCKKEACWTQLVAEADLIASYLQNEIEELFLSLGETRHETKAARQTQKIDNGIEAQTQVFGIPKKRWTEIIQEGMNRKILTDKELGVLRIAEQIPLKIPTEKQCAVLIDILNKARLEGII